MATRMVCRECGSEDVLCDAYASWNFEKQEWELQNTFDKGSFCNACDGECRIDEEEVPTPEKAAHPFAVYIGMSLQGIVGLTDDNHLAFAMVEAPGTPDEILITDITSKKQIENLKEYLDRLATHMK